MIGKTEKRQYFVVVGLGTFGLTVASELLKRGCQVTAIDKDEKKVELASEFAIDVIIADGRDKKPLEEAGVSSADAAVVSIGEDLEASFLVTLHLKELGIPWIVCIVTICPVLPLIYHYTRDNLTLSTSYLDLWIILMKNAA